MAGNIALNGVSAYGGGNLPKPASVVIAYTGQSTWSKDFSPAFITVAANDAIANVNTVDRRVENLRNAGVDVEYRRYQSAGHGFGLGTGTDAEGWLDLAVKFWKRHIIENELNKSIFMRKVEIYPIGIYLFLLVIIISVLIASRSSDNKSTEKGLIIIQEQGSFAVGGKVITNPGTFDPYNQTPEGQTSPRRSCLYFLPDSS